MLQLNYWAILVSAIVAFAIGALWYSPLLFADMWMKAQGYTPEKMKEMERTKPIVRSMAVAFACHLVTAFAFAGLVWWMAFDGWYEGILLGVLVWVGFVATTGLVANMFSDQPLVAYLIDAGYPLVYLAAMGAIIGQWRP